MALPVSETRIHRGAEALGNSYKIFISAAAGSSRTAMAAARYSPRTAGPIPMRPVLAAGQTRRPRPSGFSMMDTIVLAIGLSFFGLSFAYVAACDAL